MKPRRRTRLALIILAGFIILTGVAWLILPPPPPLDGIPYSQRVLDRDGLLLRLSLATDDRYRISTPLNEISPDLLEATLMQEDQYFWHHPGFNPLSTLRATWHAALGHQGHGGSSTITMQLARLRYGLHTRTFKGKLFQIFRALQIERHYSKKQILEAYLNIAPYGRNIEGIGAASLIYFGRKPSKLLPHQSIALSVIPQSPTRRTLHPSAANPSILHATARLSARLQPNLPITEPPPLEALKHFSQNSLAQKLLAPHFVFQSLRNHPHQPIITTTLDRNLQQIVDRKITSYINSNRYLGITNAAAMLLDSHSMEVLAHTGSADFFNQSISGQVDGTRAHRSPGSTLKPFIYALAIDQGLIHPKSMVVDSPRHFGSYTPENYDGQFAGPIPATDALARSRNLPAVALAEQLTRPTLYHFLTHAGINLPHPPSFYGLALPLGGGEVTMEDLLRLYASLANGGRLRPLRKTLPATTAPSTRILSPEAAFLTLEMLGQVPRPVTGEAAGNQGVFWKTGTSMGFRDAWSVAVFDHFVLAVWIGNFNSQPNHAFIGRTCAAPLLFQIIDTLRSQGLVHPSPLQPPINANLQKVELCSVSGHLLTPSCPHPTTGWFIPSVSPITACEVHREILVNTATGLRVPTDDGSLSLRREVCEFWPSDLLALFAKAGLPRRLPPPFTPGTGLDLTSRSGKPPQITSPVNGRIYAINPNDPKNRSIPLTAQTEPDVLKLYWFTGKEFLGSSTPNQPLQWQPHPGFHPITALDDHGRSSHCQFTLQSLSPP